MKFLSIQSILGQVTVGLGGAVPRRTLVSVERPPSVSTPTPGESMPTPGEVPGPVPYASPLEHTITVSGSAPMWRPSPRHGQTRELLDLLYCAVRVGNIEFVEALLQELEEDAEAGADGHPDAHLSSFRSGVLGEAVWQTRCWGGTTSSASKSCGWGPPFPRAGRTEDLDTSSTIAAAVTDSEAQTEAERRVRIVELLLERGFRPSLDRGDNIRDVTVLVTDPNFYSATRQYHPNVALTWFWYQAAVPNFLFARRSGPVSTPNPRVLWLLLAHGLNPDTYLEEELKSAAGSLTSPGSAGPSDCRAMVRIEVLQALEKVEGPTVILQLQAAPASSGPSTPTTTSPTTSTTTSNSMSTKSNSSALLLSSAVFSLVTAGGVALAEFSATDTRSLAAIGLPLAQSMVRERYKAVSESGRAQQLLSKVGLHVTVGDRVLDDQDVSEQFARLVLTRLDVVRINNNNGDRESDWEPGGDRHFALALKRRLARPLWPGKSWAALRTSVGNARPSLSVRLRGLRFF